MKAFRFGPLFAFDNYFGGSDLATNPTGQASLMISLGYEATYLSNSRKSQEKLADASFLGGNFAPARTWSGRFR